MIHSKRVFVIFYLSLFQNKGFNRHIECMTENVINPALTTVNTTHTTNSTVIDYEVSQEGRGQIVTQVGIWTMYLSKQKEACNLFPRIWQSVLLDCHSFPRIRQCNPRVQLYNSREGIHNPWERIALFDITIYSFIFVKSTYPFRAYGICLFTVYFFNYLNNVLIHCTVTGFGTIEMYAAVYWKLFEQCSL